LLALPDLIEQSGQIVGAIVQRLRCEIAGRIVEGGVDLLAGGKVFLRGRQVGGGVLQRKQVLPDTCGQGDVRYGTNTFSIDGQPTCYTWRSVR
jgi:hypothetical protein